jgi:hypothetical protein
LNPLLSRKARAQSHEIILGQIDGLLERGSEIISASNQVFSVMKEKGYAVDFVTETRVCKPTVGEQVRYQFQHANGNRYESAGIVIAKPSEESYHLVDIHDGAERFSPPAILVAVDR